MWAGADFEAKPTPPKTADPDRIKKLQDLQELLLQLDQLKQLKEALEKKEQKTSGPPRSSTANNVALTDLKLEICSSHLREH